MGTNYYWRRDGTHLAKTSGVGGGKFKMVWALEPETVRRTRVAPWKRAVIDEYGKPMTLRAFLRKAAKAVENDVSMIGEEFC